MECQICCNKYTSKLRQRYTCTECTESACISCVFKYILSNLGDMKCLFCDNQIIITDLKDYLSETKYKELCNKEVDHLFQIEIGMLEDTKIILEEEQRMIEMNMMITWMRKDGFSDLQIFHALTETGYIKEKPNKHLALTHRCPRCNGVIIHSTDTPQLEYTCNSCHALICGICIEEKNVDHVCDENVLDTLKHIHATCDTCPKCHAVIEKESGGCDQMFCTKCKTTFSWSTRRITTKNEVHHNPHFYEWQRESKGDTRNILDNPCEGHFLIKCQNNLNNMTILPQTLANKTLRFNQVSDKVADMAVEKGSYLRFVQGMLYHSVETIISIQERDDFIRQQFRARYLTKNIKFKKWKMRFKQHINTLRRNHETKILLLACLDCLYYIVLDADADTTMIEELFNIITCALKEVQDRHGKTINYIISTDNVILPYIT